MVAFLAGDFLVLADVFFAGAFFPGAFLPGVFFTGACFLGAFLAGAFFTGAFFAGVFTTAFLAAFFTAFFIAFFAASFIRCFELIFLSVFATAFLAIGLEVALLGVERDFLVCRLSLIDRTDAGFFRTTEANSVDSMESAWDAITTLGGGRPWAAAERPRRWPGASAGRGP